MSWPVYPTGFLSSRGDEDSYKIERSLRFNSDDSAYLNRTPASAGNRKTWTWSGWVKKARVGASPNTYTTLLSAGTTASDTNTFLWYIYQDVMYVQGASTVWRQPSQVFRDPSSWLHLVLAVDTTQATANDRIKLYVNGSQVTSFSTTNNPTQNSDLGINQAVEHNISRDTYSQPTYPNYFDGYLTEINFIDGQALTPSSFGETDAITGRWKAKAFSGTYGTNGFYLNFSDNSSLTTTSNVGIGKDFSGNGNYWATNGLSVTAGAGNDSLVDSPTNYGSDTGVGGEVRGNYCTLNPLWSNLSIGSLVDGNIKYSSTTVYYSGASGSLGVKTEKWYFECKSTFPNGYGNGSGFRIGVFDDGKVSDSFKQVIYTNNMGIPTFEGSISKNCHNGTNVYVETSTTSGDQLASGDTLNVAFDCDIGKVWFGKNGVWSGSSNPETNTGGHSFSTAIVGYLFPFIFINENGSNETTVDANFGQRPFAHTAPSGFKALCTTNLPQPTIQKPSKYMDVVAYTGTGASNSITGLDFSPDLVWIKNRGTTTSHALYDTTRGTQAQLSTNTTNDEVTSSTGLTAFDSGGFTVGTGSLVNTSGTQYVAWAWDEAPIAGFDIVSYTGNGANRTVSHNLGVSPKMLIVKARTTAGADQGWPVWHTSIANTTYLTLSTTSATATGTDYWNSTSPTSSVFSLGTNVAVNANSDTYIAYLFAEVEGFSKLGSYTGNGSSDGPFVWCGFRPRWVMVKNTQTLGCNWIIYDTARETNNVMNLNLYPDSSGAEYTGGSTRYLDVVSNGFKIRGSDNNLNDSGKVNIFAAFAESPFKYARAR